MFTGLLTWVVHAGVDWDWEMPVGALWVFAVGGLVLARRPGAGRTRLRTGHAVSVWWLALALLVVADHARRGGVSQKRLNQSVEAFQAGDCTRCDRARAAVQPGGAHQGRAVQLMAFCDARVPGLAELSIRQMDGPRCDATRELGVPVLAGAGAGRRGAGSPARCAQGAGSEPVEPLTRQAVKRFATGSRRAWVRRARSAPLPFQAQPR